MIEEADYYKHLGYILRGYRQFRKIKASEIATILGISIQQLHKYEKGKDRIPIYRLELYSEHVNVRVEDLLAWSKAMKTIR